MILSNERETMRLGARLAAAVRGGDCLCLSGPLGSGKTTLARGFLRKLGHKGEVQSPTFGIVSEYRSLKPKVHHLDLYRIKEEELANLGLEEYLSDPEAACLVEWPEVALALFPKDRLELALDHHAGGGRTLAVSALGPRARRLKSLLVRTDACAS